MKVYRVQFTSKSGGHRGWAMCDSVDEAKQRIADWKKRGYRAWIAEVEDREDNGQVRLIESHRRFQ